jgi:uncharacterized protein YjbI with pentapeptide repeats
VSRFRAAKKVIPATVGTAPDFPLFIEEAIFRKRRREHNGRMDLDISQHFKELKEARVAEWNRWWTPRANEPTTPDPGPGLVDIELSCVDLTGIDLRRWNLRGARFLNESRLAHARLSNCNLTGATWKDVDLHGASLRKATLKNARFERCNLRHANLTSAEVEGARFLDCFAYGAGLWETEGKPAEVRLLLSSKKANHVNGGSLDGGDFLIAHDLDSAAFLYLLSDNQRISAAFDQLNRSVVLILGAFAHEGLERLKMMKNKLRGKYAPIVFDFLRQERRSLTETVGALAHMSCFVIADLTNASSVPQELSHIIPFLPSVPVVPLLPPGGKPYAMFEHWLRYPWVLEFVDYGDDFGKFVNSRFEEVINTALEIRRKTTRSFPELNRLLPFESI